MECVMRRYIAHVRNVTSCPLRTRGEDDIRGMVDDIFGVGIPRDEPVNGFVGHTQPTEMLDDSYERPNQGDQFSSRKEEDRYKKLMEDCGKELYPGCSNFSKLSFMLHLFHLKCMYGWSAKSFTELLKLLIEAFPLMNSFPSTWYETRKLTKELGLGFEKINACPQDCMLYCAENSEHESCINCGLSRWKTSEIKEGGTMRLVIHKGKPVKVLRHFPLILRLKRIYMSSKNSKRYDLA